MSTLVLFALKDWARRWLNCREILRSDQQETGWLCLIVELYDYESYSNTNLTLLTNAMDSMIRLRA